MNYYLSQLIDRYTISSSARMNAWLAAMNYQSANSNGLAPFKTSGFSYPTWFTNRRSPALSFITTTNYNRPFSISTAQGQTVTTPRFTIAGAASTKVAYVDIPGHPEAVFSWVPTSANNGLWTLTNVALTSGLNTLSVRSINGDGAVGGTLSFAVTLTGNAPPVASLVKNRSLARIETASSTKYRTAASGLSSTATTLSRLTPRPRPRERIVSSSVVKPNVRARAISRL